MWIDIYHLFIIIHYLFTYGLLFTSEKKTFFLADVKFYHMHVFLAYQKREVLEAFNEQV